MILSLLFKRENPGLLRGCLPLPNHIARDVLKNITATEESTWRTVTILGTHYFALFVEHWLSFIGEHIVDQPVKCSIWAINAYDLRSTGQLFELLKFDLETFGYHCRFF